MVRDFDGWEKKLEDGPMDFIKKILPIAMPLINRPEKVSVQMKVTPKQLEDLTKLVKKWESETPTVEDLIKQLDG